MSGNDRADELRERLKCEIVESFYNEKIPMKEIRKQMQTAVAETSREIQSDVEDMEKRMR